MLDDTTTTDNPQPIPQSDQCCYSCGRPLPDPGALEPDSIMEAMGTPTCQCPCGWNYTTRIIDERYLEWASTEKGAPYPPHDAPWLDECDEPDHLTEACQRATDHYSDTEDDMADDDTTIDDPEAYLEERYGCEPVPHHPDSAEDDVLHTWAVGIGLLQIQVNRHNRRGTWSWSVTETEPGDWRDMESADGQADTLPAACRAADDAARDLLAETAERLEGCDGTEEDGDFTASGAFDPEQPLENDGTVFDLLNMVSEDGYHPTFADALADVGDEDGSPFTATVTDLGERTMISIDADADEKSTQELANELVQQRKRKAALKAKYNGEPETNDQPDPTAICSDHLAYLSRRYPDASPVPPADRFEALDVAYEVPAGLGAVRFAEQDGLLMWRRVAVGEQTGYRTQDGWGLREGGLEKVCRAAEGDVCALEPQEAP